MILEGLPELLKYYVKSNRICLKVCLDRGDFRFHSKEKEQEQPRKSYKKGLRSQMFK